MPNYRRYDIPGHPVFLTIVTHKRRPWLADDVCVETVLESMRWAKRVAGLGMRNGTSKSPLRPRPRDELLKARGTSCVRHGAALRAAPWLPQMT